MKESYSVYDHIKDIDAKARFFSPECRQICRTTPSFSAMNRDTIMRYLHETSGKDTHTIQSMIIQPFDNSSVQPSISDAQESGTNATSYYSIRALREDEMEFGTDEIVRHAGYASAAEITQTSEAQKWLNRDES